MPENAERTPMLQDIPANSSGRQRQLIARVTSHIPDKGQVMIRDTTGLTMQLLDPIDRVERSAPLWAFKV